MRWQEVRVFWCHTVPCSVISLTLAPCCRRSSSVLGSSACIRGICQQRLRDRRQTGKPGCQELAKLTAPRLSALLMSAPCCISNVMAGPSPREAAAMIASCRAHFKFDRSWQTQHVARTPFFEIALTSAPASARNFNTSKWPCLAASTIAAWDQECVSCDGQINNKSPPTVSTPGAADLRC